jgi:transcriptional regulator with XRE-family HTH domain
MTDNLGNPIGAILKEARLKAGLTLEHVALHAGICRSYVHDLERNGHLPATRAGRLILEKLDLSKAKILSALGPVARARFLTTDIAAQGAFANIMRRARAAKAVAMLELSGRTSLAIRELCAIECGATTPREATMQKIAEGLGTRLPEMVA